ncbi:MAG: hypothetical protein OXM02_13285 [Bacteroidota bacterium]|nr:hypothetical protein [Bacteroidota bacterium]
MTGQIFLYGILNRDKARLATIILAYFHRLRLDFDSTWFLRISLTSPAL